MSEKTAGRRLSELVGTPLREIEEEYVSVAEMQRRIMPDPERLEVFGDYDISGKTVPIAVVGGDYYDFIDLDGRFDIKGKMAIVIADASGHGLAAAMLIRDFNTALYTGISYQSDYLHETTPLLVKKINRRMYRSSQENQFISAFYGELQLSGVLRYINAGHYSALVFKAREILSLDVGGPVLGAFREVPSDYDVGEVCLERGDLCVCYTDGIIEASSGVEEYGVDRLKLVIQKNREKDARAIRNCVLEDVENFSQKDGQHDDRTVMIVKRELNS